MQIVLNRVKYKKIVVFIILVLFSFLIIQTVNASKLEDNLDDTAKIGLGDGSNANSVPFNGMNPEKIIGRVIGIGLSFVGILFLGLLIYGGVTWMMARGNEEDVKKSMDLIQAAIFGIIIVLLAYAITVFITDAFIANKYE